MPNADDFQAKLEEEFKIAVEEGLTHIDITSGDLHEEVGGYPGTNHRMPTCCMVMRRNMKEGDCILAQPPKGKGATLRIRYKLPRQ